MVACHVVPVVRAVRRLVVARPRVAVATLAAGRVARRVRRPLAACRDAGVLATAGSLSATTPARAPAPDFPPESPDSGTGGEADGGAGQAGGAGWHAGGLGLPGGVFTPLMPDPPRPDLLPRRLLFGPDSPPLPPTGGGTFTAAVPEPAPPVTVPEPPVLGLFLCALLAVAMLRRRRPG